MTSSAQNDGWYSNEFTTPTTTGIYRTQVCCTASSDYLCLDKTFEVKAESDANPAAIADAVWDESRSSHTTSGSFGEVVQNAIPSSSDIASATWGYSNRSLSTFNSIVSDIWGFSTRTITGADLNSGSLATKSDVTTATANITNISNNVTNIQSATNDNKELLERLINKPIITNSLEHLDDNFSIEAKISSSKNVTSQLSSKIQYLKSKTSLVETKWGTLDQSQIKKTLDDLAYTIGSESDALETKSMLGSANWLKSQWGWAEITVFSTQLKNTKSKIASIQKIVESKGKSSNTQKELKLLVSQFAKIEAALGNSNDTKKVKSINTKLNEVKTLADSYNAKSAELAKLYVSVNKDQAVEPAKQVTQLSKEVAALNNIPKVNPSILSITNTDQKGMKNKILSLIGMLDANKKLLAIKPEDTLTSTWLEIGSIVFKTLITNPSKSISQKVPVQYYLPEEIKRENIIEIDKDLIVNFDPEKNQYFASGDFELKAGESKTLSIKIDDSIFMFQVEILDGLRKQADDLAKPLEKTSFFAQGVTLKSDIDVSLNKIMSLQNSANTPEEKIRGYREGKIELDAVELKLEKLKELATNAGSVNTMFGFVGGAQVLAVWGLIIIFVAGFVFLALYFKFLKKQGVNEDSDQQFEIVDEPKPHHKVRKVIKIAAIIITVGFTTSTAIGVVLHTMNNTKSEDLAITVQSNIKKEREKNSVVLGAKTTTQTEVKGEEVTLFVPQQSLVEVFQDPSLESPILAGLWSSQQVIKIEQQSDKNGWVQVAFSKQNGSELTKEKIIGWVDMDFIETKSVATASVTTPVLAETPVQDGLTFITVSDTPTGFLRVRNAPSGKELGKIDPGKKYPVLESKSGWLKLLMDDGSFGWVSGKYTSYKQPKAIGGQIAL